MSETLRFSDKISMPAWYEISYQPVVGGEAFTLWLRLPLVEAAGQRPWQDTPDPGFNWFVATGNNRYPVSEQTARAVMQIIQGWI